MMTAPDRPARVNPLFVHPREERLSLAGEWQFRLDETPDFSPIQVPGCWQGQGFGHDGEDEVWDFRLKARVFRATHQGTGWYRREFTVPAAWEGRRLWLNFGGVHPSAEVSLNGKVLGGNDLPFVPFGFEITDRIRRDVPNSVVVRVHEHHRQFGLAFNWQGNWSGLYRGVDLVAAGAHRFTELALLPEVAAERLRVRVATDCARPLTLRLTIAGAEHTATVAGSAELTVPVPTPRLWSPDTPNLYRVDAELVDGDAVLDARSERAGFVALGTRGRHFLINDEPYYMRGTGDFISCPETGCPDTDRDRWRRKLRTLRDYGYNYVRCQSYVYPPEYFDAADEVGLLIQSEMGLLGAWGGHSQWHLYQWPRPTPDNYPTLKTQWDLVVRRDVNHPSANLYNMANEYGRDTPFHQVAWRGYRDTKAVKPTAFVIWSDHGLNPELPADFINWCSPQFKPGEIAALEARDLPIIEHEFHWWSAFPDVRQAARFSGAVRPYPMEIARAAARRRGQEHLLEVYADRSQRVQALDSQLHMEICRRDNPHLAGINHFNAMDIGLSPQGVVTELYEHKFLDAATWRQTNGDTVVLASLDAHNRVVAAGAPLTVDLFVSDYAHPPFADGELAWRLVAGDRTVAEGSLAVPAAPYTTRAIGTVATAAPDLDAPAALRFEVALTAGDRTVVNAWQLWCLPPAADPPDTAVYAPAELHTWLARWTTLPRGAAAGTLLTECLDATVLEFVERGGRAVLVAGEGLVRPHHPLFGYVKYFWTPPANYSPYEDGQNGTVIADHPMLAGLPHEGWADLQFFRTIDDAPPLDLEPLGLHDADPVIRVIHRYPVLHPLGYLVERRVGRGRLIVTALQLEPDWPEARALLHGLCTAPPTDCPKLSPAARDRLAMMTAL